MATFVLVHGGGHGGWCYQRVAKLLRKEGHDVYTPTLTGLAERSHLVTPETDLDTHITDVVSLLHYEDITDAIVVGHSYGGMVITGVADRALARVGHLVFLDAAHPKGGEALADIAVEQMAYARSSSKIINGVELVMWPSMEVVELMGITDPVESAWMLERLTPHPWKSFEQPLHLVNEAAVREIPFTNINASWGLEVRPPESLRRCLEGDRVWEVDTGHDLMITEPEETARLLLRTIGV